MMTVLALIVIPFRFLWNHKRLAVVVIVAFVALGVFNSYQSSHKPEDIAANYQENIPRQLEELDVCATNTRHYYVVSSYESGDYIYLTEYYSYDKEWERQTIPLPLKLKEVKIYKH